MPTVLTHAAVGFVAGRASKWSSAPNIAVLFTSMALAALPDADALWFGVIPYNHLFGHRGFTHSLFFAFVIGISVALLFWKARWAPQYSLLFLAMLFAGVTASHGFFDAMTDGGMGVAFFAPFENSRYFFPWRPIRVAPMSLGGLMSPRGLQVIRVEAELFWPFAVGAAIWNRGTKWRMAVAATWIVFGTVMWIIAFTDIG